MVGRKITNITVTEKPDKTKPEGQNLSTSYLLESSDGKYTTMYYFNWYGYSNPCYRGMTVELKEKV